MSSHCSLLVAHVTALAGSQLAKPDEHDSTGLKMTFTESGLTCLLVTAGESL